MKTTTNKATETETMDLEAIKARAEAEKNWPLVWMCDGAMAGDVGCLAAVRVRTRGK